MGNLIKHARWYLVAQSTTRVATAASILITAVAFAFGDGGTLTISWNPGGE